MPKRIENKRDCKTGHISLKDMGRISHKAADDDGSSEKFLLSMEE